MASLGEFIYLAYNGDQLVSWSRACDSYGKFCSRLKIALALHVIAVCCFLVLAVISAYRVFRTFDPPFVPSKEGDQQERTQNFSGPFLTEELMLLLTSFMLTVSDKQMYPRVYWRSPSYKDLLFIFLPFFFTFSFSWSKEAHAIATHRHHRWNRLF